VISIYLAARYGRKLEMREVAQRLEATGYIITSRWLQEPDSANLNENELRKAALRDSEDIFAADILVRFSDDLNTPRVPSGWCTSSRMEEAGMATAWGKQVVIVGAKQSVFDRLPDRVILSDVTALTDYLFKQKRIAHGLAEADKFGEDDGEVAT